MVILSKVSIFERFTRAFVPNVRIESCMKSIFRYTVVAFMTVVSMVLGANMVSAQSFDYTYYPEREAPKVRMEWGVGVGGSYTGLRSISTQDVKFNPRIGFNGHFDMAVCIGRNFAIETEICYEGASIKAATARDDHKVRTTTIDIPLLLSLRMANSRIRINAGPVFTVMSKAEYTDDGETMFFGPVYPTWNLAAGVGIGLGRHFIIEARYIHALKDGINQFEGEEFNTRTYRVTVGATVLF